MASRNATLMGNVGRILGIIAGSGAIAAGLLAWLGTHVYATKPEINRVVLEQTTARTKAEGADTLRDYRIGVLEVKVDNTQQIVLRTDKNVELLLIKRKLDPAPVAIMQPLPAPPTPNP